MHNLPRTGQLYIYQPHMMDKVDPQVFAVPGQVVLVKNVIGYSEIIISSPDGKAPLGFVCDASLKKMPRGLLYDVATGLTSESKQFLA
jgi:hypothetical protein